MENAEESSQEALKVNGAAFLRRALRKTHVNPKPVPYWGSESRLTELFAGEAMVETTDEDPTPRCIFVCTAHQAVVDNPDFFAAATDSDGLTAVHACALNGYLDTLKVLVEDAAAPPFAKTRSGIDTLMVARRRGHRHILQYLVTFEGQHGAAKFLEIQQRVEERRRREEAAARLAQDGGSLDSMESLSMEEAQRQREARMQEAKAAALEKSMLALQEKVKVVELLPFEIWRAERVQMDKKRGVAYYPRKAYET